MPDGETDQDLVPEPPDEAQEGDPGDQGAERAGEAGAGAEGGRGGGGCGRGPGGPELVARLHPDVDGGHLTFCFSKVSHSAFTTRSAKT